jgi:hypothetical protein
MSILVRVADMPADERVDYMQVVMIDSAPFRVTRSPKQIEQADPDLLTAYLVCGGNTS